MQILCCIPQEDFVVLLIIILLLLSLSIRLPVQQVGIRVACLAEAWLTVSSCIQQKLLLTVLSLSFQPTWPNLPLFLSISVHLAVCHGSQST